MAYRSGIGEMACPACKGPMIAGFSSWYCKSECDLRSLRPAKYHEFSLHVFRPDAKGCHETTYPGYSRVQMDSVVFPLKFTFPSGIGHTEWVSFVARWSAGKMDMVWDITPCQIAIGSGVTLLLSLNEPGAPPEPCPIP